MILRKRRIRNGWKATIDFDDGAEFMVVLSEPEQFLPQLKKMGFSTALEPGEHILPAPLGPVSRFNANGKYFRLKHLPKETVTREVEWTRKQWVGGGDMEEVTGIVDIPYQRYQREFIPPPGEELTIREKDGKKFITSRSFLKTSDQESHFIHCINLFLECFRECDLLSPDLVPPLAATKRLNWTILPPGKYPWSRMQGAVQEIIARQSKGRQNVVSSHLQAIAVHEPEFVATGNGGFTGYLVFGFPDHNLFLLESTHRDNATYVFGEHWENLSKLTKAEILNGSLQKERLIHCNGWKTRIETILKQ